MALIEDFDNYNDDLLLNSNNIVNEIDNFESILKEKDKNESKESPIFSLNPVTFEPIRNAGLKEMAISNNVICLALESKCFVLRLDLNKKEHNLSQILVSKKEGDKIHKIFMDPTANHVIVSMVSQENWYFHNSWTKTKFLSKLKGVTIESVAWDKMNDNPFSTTREILIGSSAGQIFEAVFECKDGLFLEFKERFKPIHLIGSDAVTGLHFERFPGSDSKYLIVATTPTQLYQFIGGPTFSSIFEKYDNQQGFQDLPSDLNYSILELYSSTFEGMSKEFAWLVGVGIFHGELIFGAQNAFDRVTAYETLTQFPSSSKSKERFTPLSILITDFHWIVLYSTKIQAISKLNEQIIYEQYFDNNNSNNNVNVNNGIDISELGTPIGLTMDAKMKTFWLFGSRKIIEIKINDEDRNIWALYLEKSSFEQAIKYCKTSAQRDRVWTVQANHYFSEHSYRLAATFYGKTSLSFEEITLKFIRMNDRDALKTYLIQKLENLSPKEVTQKTMICTWLVEIYLNKLNELKDQREMDMHEVWREEFKSFLKERKDSLNRATTYNLISSHGRVQELLSYAKYVGDFELVISHYIQRKEYLKALKTLDKHKGNEELFYKFSPVLVSKIPRETVRVWAETPSLNPRLLIPSFTRYEAPKGEKSDIIKYIEYCIGKRRNEDPIVHNFLVKCYVEDNLDNDLISFLKRDKTSFEKDYALRLCVNAGKTRARVIIYSTMGYYEEAVRLALSDELNDLELAKENAQKPNDLELRKKLWLLIAKHVIDTKGQIKEAMEILKQCSLLKIEDILPFFPEFTLIDDFKAEICGALEEYNKRIDELKTEMDKATDTADLIRRDIKNLRNKFVFVEQSQKCSLCNYPVLTRAFYLFPCLHAYHIDCLTNEMLKYLDPQLRARVQELHLKIGKDVPQKSLIDSVAAKKNQENMISQLEQYKLELDDIIASECCLCGDIMIDSIGQPFIGAEEEDAVNGWKINLLR